MSLFHIAYISRNTINGDDDDIKTEIAKILESARRNNPAMQITGALLYSGGYFCQVIEGTEEALETLFEIIQMDERHADVTVLHFEPLEERNFADWSMALAGIENTSSLELEGVLKSKDEMQLRAAGGSIVSTLDNLIKQHQALID